MKAFEDDEFLQYINLQPTPALTLRAKKYYIPGLEDVDKRRIEEVYDAHGYFDAKVESIDVEVVNPDNPLKRHKVHVKLVVDEGSPTIVRTMAIQWDPSTPATVDRKAIEAAATIEKGSEFSIPRFEGTKDAMVLALRDHGHALARVHHEADVDKRRKVASVSYRIIPGPRLDIGKITIEGLDHVPEYLVQREVEDFEGKQFSPERFAGPVDLAGSAKVQLGCRGTVDPPTADCRTNVELHDGRPVGGSNSTPGSPTRREPSTPRPGLWGCPPRDSRCP